MGGGTNIRSLTTPPFLWYDTWRIVMSRIKMELANDLLEHVFGRRTPLRHKYLPVAIVLATVFSLILLAKIFPTRDQDRPVYSPYSEKTHTTQQAIRAAMMPRDYLVEPAHPPTPTSGAQPIGPPVAIQAETVPQSTDQPLSGPVIAASDRSASLVRVPFTLELDPILYPGQEAELRAWIDQALATAAARFVGSDGSLRRLALQPINIYVTNDVRCGLRGHALTEGRNLQVFTCNTIAPSRAVAILAHEVVHQLAYDYYGPREIQDDLILVEGLATWGAGPYWLGGHTSFRSYAAGLRRQGFAYDLDQGFSFDDVAAMNGQYYQWASFVEFLIERNGHAAFDQLYTTGNGAMGSADYRGVYNADLATLQREWLAWLNP